MMGIRTVLVHMLLAVVVSAQSNKISLNCGDEIQCLPRKSLRCGAASVYDVAFALDGSSSMKKGIQNTKKPEDLTAKDVPLDSCLTQLDGKDNCVRRDISRILLRQVMLKLFINLQQPCLEYLQSIEFIDTKLSCRAMGMTVPRFHVAYWAQQFAFGATKQVFLGPGGEQTGYNKEFTEYFYIKKNGIWEPKNLHWDADPFNPKLKTESVQTWFEEIFMKENGPNEYPKTEGLTYPSYGLEKVKTWIEAAYKGPEYSNGNGDSAVFPTFLMTDGYLSAERGTFDNGFNYVEERRMENEIQDLRDSIDDKSKEKVKLYGMGLTGRESLVLQQKGIFDRTGFQYKSNGVEYFFNNKASVDAVTTEILSTIESNCEECYTFDTTPVTEPLCGPRGRPVPSFSELVGEDNDEDTRPPKPPVDTTGMKLDVKSQTLSFSQYVKIENTVYEIPKDTKICWNYYAGYEDYKIVDYDIMNVCTCCADFSVPCLCDYSGNSQPQTLETVKGVEILVDNYIASTPLAIEILAEDQISEVSKVGGPLTEDSEDSDPSGNSGEKPDIGGTDLEESPIQPGAPGAPPNTEMPPGCTSINCVVMENTNINHANGGAPFLWSILTVVLALPWVH